MVLPLLMAGSVALGSIYTGGKAFDNFRYWSDYRGNTGFSPKYPFKSGEFDYLRSSSALGFSYSGLKNLSSRKSRPGRIPRRYHGDKVFFNGKYYTRNQLRMYYNIW